MEGVILTGSSGPRVDLTGLSVKSSTSERAEVNVQFQIMNPHHQQLDLVDIDFTFEDEEHQQVAAKKVQYSYEIQGCSSKSMEVPLDLEYREVKLVPSSMRAELRFRQALTGAFKVSIEKVKSLFNAPEELKQGLEVQRVTGYVNGMHISSLSPTQVCFMIILRVSNGNTIPVRLDKANFTLESGEGNEDVTGNQVLVEKVVEARQSIPGRSQKRVEIPLTIKFDEVQPGVIPKPGKALPFKLKMDFWFMDSTHGAYKISQEKSGSFPLLTPAVVEIKEVSFERSADGLPVARMKAELKNSVPAGFKLTRLDYGIRFADESKGGEVARAELVESEMEVSEGKTLFEAVVEPIIQSAFGSALWDVFSDHISTFKPEVSVQGNSSEFGTITM